jgi:peptide/nickel transport system substrate-binding protein
MAPEVASLDPHRQTVHGGFSVVSNLYEGLTALDKDMRVAPALAVRWENPDELTWRFHLRSRVSFHDGRPLRVADVVASLERARRPGSSGQGGLAVVREIVSPQPDVIVIRTDRPNPTLLTNLTSAFVVPADAPDEIAQPIGTGPYRFVSHRPGRSLDLQAFEKHWNGPPSIQRLSFLFEPDPGRRVDLLATGAVDVALRLPETTTVPPGARYRVLWRAAPGTQVIGLRVDRPPFADPRVRRAIRLAVDRDALTRGHVGGPALSLGQPLPPGIFGHVPDLRPPGRDLEAARGLLREAGDLGPVVLEHGPGRQREAERLTAQLGEAGLPVSLAARSVTELIPRLDAGESHMLLFSYTFSTGDTVDFFESILHSRDGRGFGTKNWFGYVSPAVDSLIESVSGAPEMGARLPAYQQALRLAIDDAPFVPLWQLSWVYGVGADVQWTPAANGWFDAATAHRK